MEMDLAAELGAIEESSTQRLTLYVPNKDRNGRKVKNYERWVKEARALLSLIGGGATALPPADGTWANEAGTLIWEQTRIVYCFVFAEQLEARIKDLREFVHRFGRETNQGEVVVEFDECFYRIREFEPGARDYGEENHDRRKKGRTD